MYALGSNRDMETLVSPMRGAAVASPLAKRLACLTAYAVLLARLNIVGDGEQPDDDGGWGTRCVQSKDRTLRGGDVNQFMFGSLFARAGFGR